MQHERETLGTGRLVNNFSLHSVFMLRYTAFYSSLTFPFSIFNSCLLEIMQKHTQCLGQSSERRICGLTIHLSLIRKDDLPASTRRIDSQGLLEALFNVRAPHPLGIIVYRLVCRVAHPLQILGRTLTAAPAAGINRGGWALQAEAWSRLGRDLEFPNKQTQPRCHSPQQNIRHLLSNNTAHC